MKLSERLEKAKKPETKGIEMPNLMTFNPNVEKTDKYDNIKKIVHRKVIDEYNKEIQENDGNEDNVDLRQIINDILIETGEPLPKIKRDKLVQEIYDDIVGLGPFRASFKG